MNLRIHFVFTKDTFQCHIEDSGFYYTAHQKEFTEDKFLVHNFLNLFQKNERFVWCSSAKT